MIMYMSGWHSDQPPRTAKVIASGELTHRCFSFAAMQSLPGLSTYAYVPWKNQTYQMCREAKIGIMMDSGAVSYRMIQERHRKKASDLLSEDDFVRRWVSYCKKHSKEWDLYFTLDLERISSDIYRRHCKLLKMGVKPIPVVHGDDDVSDYFQRYKDLGHKIIGLNSRAPLRGHSSLIVRRYLDTCFDISAKLGLKLHGLGYTTPWILIEYPWSTLDSSSWTQVATRGSIMEFDEGRERITTITVSDRVPLLGWIESDLKQHLREKGFDLQELRTDLAARHVYNLKECNRLVAYATKRNRQ